MYRRHRFQTRPCLFPSPQLSLPLGLLRRHTQLQGSPRLTSTNLKHSGIVVSEAESGGILPSSSAVVALLYVNAPVSPFRVQASSAVGSRFSIKSLIVMCTMAACRHVVPVYVYRGNAAVVVVDQGDRLAAAGRDLNVVAVIKRVHLDGAVSRPSLTTEYRLRAGRSFRISAYRDIGISSSGSEAGGII